MTTDDMRTVLTRRMAELNLTYYGLRLLTGVDESVIEGFIQGSNPQINTLQKILSAVGIEIVTRPIKGFTPPPPTRGRGRPKLTDRASS